MKIQSRAPSWCHWKQMEHDSLFPTNTSAQCGVPLTWCFSESTAVIQQECYICSCIICENHCVCVYRKMSMREERWRKGERSTHLQQSVLVPLFATHTPPPLLFFPLISPSRHLAGSGSRMRYWKDMLHINMQPYEGECVPVLVILLRPTRLSSKGPPAMKTLHNIVC